MKGSVARFIFAAGLIVATALFLRARTHGEVFPPRLALQSFPQHIGNWTGEDITIDKDTLQVLGPGDFLLRVYTDSEQRLPYIDLFIAYFPSQSTNDTMHSPKNCLPGAGWAPIESQRMTLDIPGHVPFPVNRYVIAKGDSRQVVLYWYWAHDRGVASEYWAKYYLVADSIRMNRSDGSLVRVTSPLLAGESPDAAQQRLLPFVAEIVPKLQSYIPR
ncbi:MAG TPA: EpsI family protein [Candidatus Sulfotelmatobacter sp.]|nr:EpsI family protein [Candidatus Sulfotelmatobacter sp.]